MAHATDLGRLGKVQAQNRHRSLRNSSRAAPLAQQNFVTGMPLAAPHSSYMFVKALRVASTGRLQGSSVEEKRRV
jgi:hypothetical protein